MSNEGIEKGAMLLLSLGEDQAAEVLKHLTPKEVQKLGHAMAEIKGVPRDRIEAVLDELESHTAKGTGVTADEAMIRNMLTKALGDDRASNLISRILQGDDTMRHRKPQVDGSGHGRRHDPQRASADHCHHPRAS